MRSGPRVPPLLARVRLDRMSRLAQLEKLHAADPSDADVAYMIAQEHAKSGDNEAARAWFDRCLSIDAGYLYAYFHKARAQQKAGDTAGALSSARIGHSRAVSAGNAKAAGELASLIEELEG